MSTKIGHFEILSELAKSCTSTVYKANDLESGQTIALKAIQLSAFGESAAALEQALLKEAEDTKVLSSPNLTAVSGAGQIEGQFCAAMEYIQGNSIATMLARKEGFSIWDLLDIGRQLCSGLEHASAQHIVHYSLEPSKIMCGWDGTVKILSFGVSSVGNFVQHSTGPLSSILHYMSPEQVRGEAMDSRSNLFSLGAMFYEMVTERKAFDREDAESLRQSILESTPVAPLSVNPKVHPLLSSLIMKAMAKDPAERYQTGRELLEDLEKCKESRPAKKAEAPKGTVVPDKVKAAVQSKFVGTAGATPVCKAFCRSFCSGETCRKETHSCACREFRSSVCDAGQAIEACCPKSRGSRGWGRIERRAIVFDGSARNRSIEPLHDGFRGTGNRPGGNTDHVHVIRGGR